MQMKIMTVPIIPAANPFKALFALVGSSQNIVPYTILLILLGLAWGVLLASVIHYPAGLRRGMVLLASRRDQHVQILIVLMAGCLSLGLLITGQLKSLATSMSFLLYVLTFIWYHQTPPTFVYLNGTYCVVLQQDSSGADLKIICYAGKSLEKQTSFFRKLATTSFGYLKLPFLMLAMNGADLHLYLPANKHLPAVTALSFPVAKKWLDEQQQKTPDTPN